MKRLTKLFISGLCVVTALSFSACELLESTLASDSNLTSGGISVEGTGIEIFEGNYKQATTKEVARALQMEEILSDGIKTDIDSNDDLIAYSVQKLTKYTARYGGMYCFMGQTFIESLDGRTQNTSTKSEEGKIVEAQKGGRSYYQIYGENGEKTHTIYNDGAYTYKYSGEKSKREESLDTMEEVVACLDGFSDALASGFMETLLGDIASTFGQYVYIFESREFEGTSQWEMDTSDSQYIKVKLTAKGTYTGGGFDWEDEEDWEPEPVDMQIISVYDKNLNLVANYMSNNFTDEPSMTGEATTTGKTVLYMFPCSEITPPKDLDDYVAVESGKADSSLENQSEKVESSSDDQSEEADSGFDEQS